MYPEINSLITLFDNCLKVILIPIFALKSRNEEMKKINAIKSTIIFMLFSFSVSAQLPTMDFLYGFNNDARLLLQEYIRPYANIFGANLNAGWYNTAEPHKLGGFDITTTFSIAFAPTSALTYDLSSLTELRAEVEGVTTIAPTAAGNMEIVPELVYKQQVVNPLTSLPETFELARVKHPNGAGLDFLPLPMAQLTIGLIKGTDVSVRYVPDITFGDYGEIGLFGIGGRHSISQWIPVLKKLKFINIAIQGGYTKVSTSAHLNMDPIAEVEIDNPPNWETISDQYMNLNISGWTVNLIASQSIPVITVYEGIGYSSSLVDMAITGTFPLNSIVTEQGPDFGKTTYVVVQDPIDELKFENYKNLRLNAGIRFKLGILTLHYDFTRTLYSTHTAGLGITFR